MTSFRLSAGKSAIRLRDSGLTARSRRTRTPATGAVGILSCGHKYYEPFIQHGRLIWCEDCEHNREKKKEPKLVVPETDQDELFLF